MNACFSITLIGVFCFVINETFYTVSKFLLYVENTGRVATPISVKFSFTSERRLDSNTRLSPTLLQQALMFGNTRLSPMAMLHNKTGVIFMIASLTTRWHHNVSSSLHRENANQISFSDNAYLLQ